MRHAGIDHLPVGYQPGIGPVDAAVGRGDSRSRRGRADRGLRDTPPASQSLVLSPDGTRFAAVNSDDQLQLRGVATWTWFGPAFDWGDDSFLFSPDGRQVAHLEDDRLSLRDGRNGEVLARLPMSDLVPEARMAYLPDGSGILVAGLDGSTWTVPAEPSAWLERARRTAGRNLTRSEWNEFFPGRSYEVTCPEWPAGT